MIAALEGGEWSAARPGRTLPPGKTRYPFYKRLGGPQGRSGRAENLVPTGIRSRTVKPVVQSLYWLSYPPHLSYKTSKPGVSKAVSASFFRQETPNHFDPLGLAFLSPWLPHYNTTSAKEAKVTASSYYGLAASHFWCVSGAILCVSWFIFLSHFPVVTRGPFMFSGVYLH